MSKASRTDNQGFLQKLLGIYTGGVLTKLIHIGYQTGLFEEAAKGPGTSAQLSERAGLHERYVREWLGAMTTAGIFDYDPPSQQYTLPGTHAAVLTGHTSTNLAPQSGLINHLGKDLEQMIRCFREGGGIPYEVFRPEFTDVMDDTWRRIYDEQLVDGFLAAVHGLRERLQRGIRVADIGCGTGHAINLMAETYPRSSFFGYDLSEDAIAKASAEARALGLRNAQFEVRDVVTLPTEPKFDLITAFDAIHDQVSPGAVLGRCHETLARDGTFLMIDFKFSSDVADNVDNPFAPLYYGVSVLHCMTVSLAHGGAGLGTVWGEQTARRMLNEAGFGKVEAPRPQNCIYICQP
jgi:2-polyprenyl-3-methyl-5-hydroxy-6-metoxy-1,4-benzoquinol methylase